MNRSEIILNEVARCPSVQGVALADILTMSRPLRVTLTEIMKHGPMTVDQIALSLDVDVACAGEFTRLFVERGYLQEVGPMEDAVAARPAYRVALAPLRSRPISEDL